MVMKYADLRDFLSQLEAAGELRRVADPISTRLEMTAASDLALRRGGPALLFEAPIGYKIPALTNLFGTPRRVALGMGATGANDLRAVGQMLSSLKEPEPPSGLKDAGRLVQMAQALWKIGRASCRERV